MTQASLAAAGLEPLDSYRQASREGTSASASSVAKRGRSRLLPSSSSSSRNSSESPQATVGRRNGDAVTGGLHGKEGRRQRSDSISSPSRRSTGTEAASSARASRPAPARMPLSPPAGRGNLSSTGADRHALVRNPLDRRQLAADHRLAASPRLSNVDHDHIDRVPAPAGSPPALESLHAAHARSPRALTHTHRLPGCASPAPAHLFLSETETPPQARLSSSAALDPLRGPGPRKDDEHSFDTGLLSPASLSRLSEDAGQSCAEQGLWSGGDKEGLF